jgi:hypothetical protein
MRGPSSSTVPHTGIHIGKENALQECRFDTSPVYTPESSRA